MSRAGDGPARTFARIGPLVINDNAVNEIVETEGHLIDSRLMTEIFDSVVKHGASFEVLEFATGGSDGPGTAGSGGSAGPGTAGTGGSSVAGTTCTGSGVAGADGIGPGESGGGGCS